ncbi:MAG: D-sedoheptulose 7-phosphate isomerase [Rhodothermales bacterium]
MTIHESIQEHLAVCMTLQTLEPAIGNIAERMVQSLQEDGKICWMGNGGSAADCQHLAAEFVGRFEQERSGLASIAFTTDSSILTAIGNDYGFESIFSRQVEALCRQADVVVGISTSGNSENVCSGLERARLAGCYTVAFTGRSGGRMAEIADVALVIQSHSTARIQEAHILIGHLLCKEVEASMVRLRVGEGSYV